MEKRTTIFLTGVEKLLLQLGIYFEKRILVSVKLLRNVALTKDRIRMCSGLYCNNHICIEIQIDSEIQAASLSLPHTENSYIFIITAYCMN